MTSRLSQMQAKFQQKQMAEKEEKLLKLYENQQQRAFERVGRGSAGSNGSLTNLSTGKVRQMFDERRQKAGIDRSYPLEPLKNKTNRAASLERKNAPIKATKSLNATRNGIPLVNRREIAPNVYNNNGGEETYDERRYVDDEADNYLKEHRDIVEMMNNHNLGDALDDEQLPRIGFDDFEDPIFVGKLPNVGKLPSQNGIVKKTAPATSKPTPTKPITKTVTSPVKKDTKQPVQLRSKVRTVNRASNSGSIQPNSSTPPSPANSKMSRQQSTTDRSPSTARPSARTSRPPNNVVREDLSICRYCQRRFAADRLGTHEEICSKTAKKKRKTYDATKHRLAGTELEPFARKIIKAPSKNASSTHESANSKSSGKQMKTPAKSSWRQKHEEFISAIRAAKQAQAHLAKGGSLKDLPPPPPSSNPDYIQCPHCGRRFNESAAERHIPKCANYQYNKPKASSSGGKIPPKRASR